MSAVGTLGSDAAASGESAQAELGSFAAALLEKCGGIVEWDDSALRGVAELPENVAKSLGVPQSVGLAATQEPGALCVSLASEFLDVAQTALETFVGRVGGFGVADHYLTKGDPQTLVDRSFTWHNARVRVREATMKSVDYHSWWFFASIKSEDVWEGRVNVTVNSASRAAVDLPDLLELRELTPNSTALPTTAHDTYETAAVLARSRTLREAAGFMARMESRCERDRKRLRDYYGAMRREAAAAKHRGEPPAKEEVDARKRAIDLELDRKLLELDERYQTEAVLEPIVLACVSMNVLAVELRIQRKRAERSIDVYWNPLTKSLEPMTCSRCSQVTYSVAFTDEEVAPLCAACYHAK